MPGLASSGFFFVSRSLSSLHTRMSRPDLTLLINAGGLSRRMGQHKALLRVGDEILITYILRRLRPLAQGGVVVVANDRAIVDALPEDPGLRVVGDRWPQGGALGGLATGLSVCRGWTMAVACDMPFVDAGLFGYLASLTGEGWDAVVPQTDQHAQVFHAIYHPRCVPVMEAMLRSGKLVVQAAFDQLRVRWVSGEDLARRMTTPDAFLNINTPAEWDAVQERLQDEGGI